MFKTAFSVIGLVCALSVIAPPAKKFYGNYLAWVDKTDVRVENKDAPSPNYELISLNKFEKFWTKSDLPPFRSFGTITFEVAGSRWNERYPVTTLNSANENEHALAAIAYHRGKMVGRETMLKQVGPFHWHIGTETFDPTKIAKMQPAE